MAKELKVFFVAQDIIAYIARIDNNMPKSYKTKIGNRLMNIAFNFQGHITRANSMNFITDIGSTSVYIRRRDMQYEAIADLREIEQVMSACRAIDGNIVTAHQHEVLGRLLSDAFKLTTSWGKSDRKRFIEHNNLTEDQVGKFDEFLTTMDGMRFMFCR